MEHGVARVVFWPSPGYDEFARVGDRFGGSGLGGDLDELAAPGAVRGLTVGVSRAAGDAR
ncbi:hypothetical protein [Kyrpidia spormannii]|uniref:hypothetical protein n=1 Tax=Kyrpidia spormannii TaxID=2055160 RepID=UPI00147571EB|nr:hypothetical protein [Kyrpidia spormannii]